MDAKYCKNIFRDYGACVEVEEVVKKVHHYQ